MWMKCPHAAHGARRFGIIVSREARWFEIIFRARRAVFLDMMVEAFFMSSGYEETVVSANFSIKFFGFSQPDIVEHPKSLRGVL